MSRAYREFIGGRRYRSPEVPDFLAAYARAVGEMLEYYAARKDDRAESVYRQLLEAAPSILSRVHNAEALGGLASTLEKYQTLLTSAADKTKASELIKEIRAKQDQLKQKP